VQRKKQLNIKSTTRKEGDALKVEAEEARITVKHNKLKANLGLR
jgi:hypothetical protein